MSKNFSKSEKILVNLFEVGALFNFKGENYRLLERAKPRGQTSGGEPKTDLYLLAQNIKTKSNLELKISFKQKNYDFLENKTSLERAKQILGQNAQTIIS